MNKSIWKYTLKREKVLGVSEEKILSTPELVADFLKAIDFHTQEQEHLISIFKRCHSPVHNGFLS